EFAMRAALGAGRARMVRQLLTETVLLALASGVLAIVVARLAVTTLGALVPAGLPRVAAIGADAATFAFGLTTTTIVGLLVGLVPALQASRSGRVQAGLQLAARGSAGDHRRIHRALVVVEVALALVLLVGAGLLLRSLQQLFAVAPGFDP